jgi:predicted dehydrogenase
LKEIDSLTMQPITRRIFNQTAASSVAAIGTTSLLTAPVFGANDRIRLGFIGLGNRGDQVLDAFMTHKDCEVAAICDIYQPYLDFAAKKLGTNPQQYRDYRKLLDDKSIDAVVIETPDHWHALQMIEACAAGKDVYVEKPLSLCVAEGRAMVRAASTHKRIVQVGIQRMTGALGREVADLLRGGAIGRVTSARAFHIQNEWPLGIGKPSDGTPPEGFDWNAWLGPAPMKPYNQNRTFYRFRCFYDYSGGQVTNFGVHYLASIHQALGLSAPLSVVAMGGKFANYDNREIPDTLEAIWHYPGDILVSFTQFNSSAAPAAARACEVEFRGTLGTLYLTSSGYEVVPEIILPNEFAARTPVDRSIERAYHQGGQARIEGKKGTGKISDIDHARNFLDCIKSRKQPNCDLEFAHRATSSALIANIALRTRSFLDWNATTETFENHPEANQYLRYDYREPYRFPT